MKKIQLFGNNKARLICEKDKEMVKAVKAKVESPLIQGNFYERKNSNNIYTKNKKSYWANIRVWEGENCSMPRCYILTEAPKTKEEWFDIYTEILFTEESIGFGSYYEDGEAIGNGLADECFCKNKKKGLNYTVYRVSNYAFCDLECNYVEAGHKLYNFGKDFFDFAKKRFDFINFDVKPIKEKILIN